jgi:hemerythrin
MGMPLLTWKPEFRVGNRELDLQHQRLMEILNEVRLALSEGKSTATLDAPLRELIRIAKAHFATEERYMQAARFPGYGEHRQQHEALARQMSELAADVRAGRTGISVRICKLLSQWLEQHIRITDQVYAKHCRQLQALGPQLAAR